MSREIVPGEPGDPGTEGQAIFVAEDGTMSQADAITAALPGATASSRHVGGTVSGAPATGTFLLGDFVIDQTGKVWICTTAGSPGTWTQA